MQNADTDLCSFTAYRNLLIFAYLLMCFVFLLLSSGYDALPALTGTSGAKFINIWDLLRQGSTSRPKF